MCATILTLIVQIDIEMIRNRSNTSKQQAKFVNANDARMWSLLIT
jgi:hypothetical protein